MKKCMLTVILCLLTVGSVVLAQSDRNAKPQPQRGRPDRAPAHRGPNSEMVEAMQGMQIREREMDLEEREIELESHRRMKELEFKKHEAGLKMYFQKLGGDQKKDWGSCKKGDGKCSGRSAGNCGVKGRRMCGGNAAHLMCMGLFGLTLIVVHVLLAIWIFTDIRKRNAGSGIWIVVTLMIGFPGAVLYLLARIGDVRAE
jgi:hypothetical protein